MPHPAHWPAGGAVGIAQLSAIEIGTTKSRIFDLLGDTGITPTPAQDDRWQQFVLTIEEKRLRHIDITH